MVTVQVICAGYRKDDGSIQRCGKLLSSFESKTPGISHGMCDACMNTTLAIVKAQKQLRMSRL